MRNSKHSALLILLITVGVALAMPTAFAGDKQVNKEREAARRMQIMQQQFSAEKAVLEKDKTDLAQKVDDLTKQTESSKQDTAQLERKRSSLTKELATAKIEAVALQEKLRQLEITHAELVTLHKQESENNQSQIRALQAALAQRGQVLGSCETKNSKLYELNREILTKYRDKSFMDALTQNEPLTGIKAVGVENILEDYRDKLDVQRVEGGK